jgi:pimeloyl-ACP methyl ester carboxylesterase
LKQAYLDLSGLKIRYLEADKNVVTNGDAGDKNEKQNILFIHGLGSSADRWLDIPDALSLNQDLHAIAIDLPGFGLSDKPVNIDYTIEEFIKVVASFIRSVGIEKASIVGHSLGGYIAAQLAIEHRNLVDKLVLIDSSGMLEGPTPLLLQYLEAATKPSRQVVREVFEQLVANPIRIPDVLVDGFIYRIAQPGALHAFKSAFDNSVYTQIGIEKLKRIGESRVPTMVMWGMQDNLIPLKYFRVFQEAIMASEVVIVQDAGHAPFAEKPAIVSELLRKFLCKSCP